MASNPFNESFDRLVQSTLQDWHMPGIAFSVVHGEETWSKGYGFAQREPRKSVEPDTLFYVASTTKAQLCACWTIYIESEINQRKPSDERISWSTPLADIIRDDFVLQDSVATRQVTLEDSVSHRSGMPRHDLTYGNKGPSTTRDVTRNLRNLPLHNTLRTHFEYCNITYMAAAHALEVVTGKDFSQIVREYLWEPLGMKDTYAGYKEAAQAVRDKGAVLAKGYTYSKVAGDEDEASGELHEEEYMDFPEVSGAGYVISTANDYAKWMRALISCSGPVSEKIRKEVWTPRSITSPDDDEKEFFDGEVNLYGLGWFIATYKGHKFYYHPGGIIGAGSLILLVPGLKWGATFLANGDSAHPRFKGLIFHLLDRVLGVPEAKSDIKSRMDEKFREYQKEEREKYAKRRKDLYPSAPAESTVPLALPIKEYCGTYNNVGYGSITIKECKLADGKEGLSFQWDRTWPCLVTFEHVNAESWIISQSFGLYDPLRTPQRAESKVGVDGKVEGFSIVAEPAMPDTMMWFSKQK